MRIRPARPADLDALCRLEDQCFMTDRISRRSFARFLKRPENAGLLLAESETNDIAAYGLNLYRNNISLARLYSIACSESYRGQGLGEQLMIALEGDAQDRACAYWRLELRNDQPALLHWYQSQGFAKRGDHPNYYEDGCGAIKMEKRLLPSAQARPRSPYYAQTTPFTCGPSALLMAMAQQTKDSPCDQIEEINIWREATTVYMTQGIGGCSGEGLAIAAAKRGFAGTLWVTEEDSPFTHSVRDSVKKQLIAAVHDDFVERLRSSNIQRRIGQPDFSELRRLIDGGHSIVALISTWSLNRNRAPHWVHLVDVSDKFVYINDPDMDAEDWQRSTISDSDFSSLPMTHRAFERARSYGKNRFSAVLCIKKPSI